MRGKISILVIVVFLFAGLMGLTACNSGGGSGGSPDAAQSESNVQDQTDNSESVASTPTDSNPDDEGNTSGDAGETDSDGDGIVDSEDNCPDVANPGQDDGDGNGVGDACEPDSDNDGIIDVADNCPNADNPGQEDGDGNGIGDACDVDSDGDGVIDFYDNCPNEANADQADSDGDGSGDVCDNCPAEGNADQADRDGDNLGNVCDPSPLADSFAWIGNTPLTMPAGAIDDNDPDGTAVKAEETTSAAGGAVAIHADGGFSYTPPDGFRGQDSFEYTAVNGANEEAATVAIQMDILAWYVDNQQPDGQSGSYDNPFDTLAAAEAASLPADIIYVFTGSGGTEGQDSGISLKPDQKLLGQGQAFSYNGIQIVAAGSKPILSNAAVMGADPVVSLADGNEVAGLQFDAVVNEALLARGVNDFNIHDNSFNEPNNEAIRLISVSGEGAVVRNLIADSKDEGIHLTNIDPDNGGAITDVLLSLSITGNTLSGAGQAGIDIELGGNGTAVSVVASGNQIDAAGAVGFYATVEDSAKLSLLAQGNTMRGCVLEGIGLGATNAADLIADVKDNILQGNGGLADLSASNNGDASLCLQLTGNTSNEPVLNPATFRVDNSASGSFSFFESGNDLDAVRSGDITDVAQGTCALP